MGEAAVGVGNKDWGRKGVVWDRRSEIKRVGGDRVWAGADD